MYQWSKSWSHINNTVVLTILTFQHIQCLHLMYAEVAWALVSSGTQVQPQITPDPDYLSVSYDYGLDSQFEIKHRKIRMSCQQKRVSYKRIKKGYIVKQQGGGEGLTVPHFLQTSKSHSCKVCITRWFSHENRHPN